MKRFTEKHQQKLDIIEHHLANMVTDLLRTVETYGELRDILMSLSVTSGKSEAVMMQMIAKKVERIAMDQKITSNPES